MVGVRVPQVRDVVDVVDGRGDVEAARHDGGVVLARAGGWPHEPRPGAAGRRGRTVAD